MKEFILPLLQTILTVTIPIVAGYVVAFLKKKSEQTQEQISNETAKKYLAEVSDAVGTAVTATSQTYVDALKKENAFTKEAQSEAFDMAMKTALAILSQEAADFIWNVYGDIEDYLTPKIEEAVLLLKNQGIGVGIPFEIAEE